MESSRLPVNTTFSATTSLIYLLTVAGYSTLIYVIFFAMRKWKPELFEPAEKSQPLNLTSHEITFLDCSGAYTIFPCSCCSFRALLGRCCPKKLTCQQYIMCECIRPAIQGSVPYKVNLVCCMV